MRWGRTVVVAVMVMAPVWVAAPHARAAPMTGVLFVSPIRAFDSADALVDLPAGIHQITLPPPPGPATQALVQITVIPPASGSRGVLMTHSCTATADPLTDVALPLQFTPGAPTAQVYVPVTNGTICVTTTVSTPRVVVDLEGWVIPGGGAAYVDLPLSFVTTVDSSMNDTPIDFSAFGVPPDAAGVAVWLDALSPTAGFATLYPCGEPRPLVSQANWVADQPTTTLVAGVAVSAKGLCIFILGGASIDISIDGYYAPNVTPTSTSPPQVRWAEKSAPGFVGTSPTRLFDTRTAGAPVFGGQEYRLDLSPYVPIDTTAVVMNVTATEPAGDGFVTVYPCDGPRPLASSLNYTAGETVPNLVTVDAGSALEVCFFALTTTHILADLAGYYVQGGGSGFAPSPPVRMFDTRKTTKLLPGSVFEFDLSSYVPSDATAAVFNLTATEVDGPGFITAYPCGLGRPLASNLNVTTGQTVPNLVTVALPSNKHVCFFTVSGTHLLADLAGWYAPSATSGFISIPPIRWIDTREQTDLPVPAGSVAEVLFGTDFPDATAMVFNATVTEPVVPGFLTAYPCAPAPPLASNVNFVTNQTVPNMVISAVDSNGSVCMFNSAPLHWIIDVSGFFTDAPIFVSYSPDGTDIS